VACGPLGAGFVPAERLQELRSLMHTRKQVSREETRHVHPNESAGKRKPMRLRHRSPWPKTMLVQCAWAAKRKKDRPIIRRPLTPVTSQITVLTLMLARFACDRLPSGAWRRLPSAARAGR
jgi:hypothetical protein